MGCEALATKSEVAELRQTVAILAGQLATKIDKTERQPIVEDSINGANARYGLALVPVALPALTTLIPYIAGLIALLSSFLGLQNLINGLQSLIGSHQSDIDRILGRLRFIEDKNSEQDELLHYFRDYAIPILKADISILKQDLGKANAEITKANNEIRRLDGELSKANAAITAANTEIKRVAGIANQAASDANKAIAETQAINQKLEREYKPVIQLAISKADFAIQTINNLGNDLIQELETQSGRISSLESQNTRLASLANAARADANRAIEIANNALSSSQQAQSTSNNAASTANNVSQEIRNGVQIRYFEPTITNAIIRINQQVTNTSVQQASSEIQRTLSQGNQQITQQYAAAAQASTQIRNTSIQSASDEIQRRLAGASAEIQRTLATAADNVRSQFNSGTIERAIVTSPTIVDIKSRVAAPTSTSVSAQIEDFRNRLTEQERVNQLGLTEIGLMAGAIAALPNTFAQNPGYRAAMTDVAAAGTCQTTKPGGCMANQFQNLQNGQNNLANQLNLGLQSGQGLLLNQINNGVQLLNTKVGDLPLVGGVAGYLSNIGSFLGDSRFLQVLTLAGTLHNCWMLSGNIAQTYFQIVDSLVNIPTMVFNPNGEKVESQKIFGQALNLFMSETIGLKAWTDLQIEAKSLNNILNTSANLWNNLQQITNDTQQLCNQARNYVASLGNALQDEGVIGEDNWDYRDPNKYVNSPHMGKIQRMADGLEAIDQGLQAINMVTQTFVSIIDNGQQIKTNFETIGKELETANKAAKELSDEAIKNIQIPEFNLDDMF